MPGIIQSLLDTDLYKFTMMQAVLHQFPGAQVEYKFKCRSAGVQLAPYMDEIRDEIRQLCELHFTEDELAYMRGMRFIKSDFVDFLGLFKLNQKYIDLTALPNGEIDIRVRGPWLHTIMFEIPVLAIVSEVYFRNTQPGLDLTEGRRRLQDKIALMKGVHDLKIADYGTRRRFSLEWQREVLQTLQADLGTGPDGQLTGTSNVLFAMELGMRPMGTMAHEYLQACQALGPRLRDSQVFGFEKWAQEYRGDLGIALSDVYGMNAFLRDFDMYFCKLFDGARHDSGDPFPVGRTHDRALPGQPCRSAQQGHHLQRRADHSALHRAARALSRPHPDRLWRRHQPDQRPRPRRAATGVEDDRMQRPAGGQDLGHAGQDHGGGRGLPGLPAPGVRPARTAANHHAHQPLGAGHALGDCFIIDSCPRWPVMRQSHF